MITDVRDRWGAVDGVALRLALDDDPAVSQWNDGGRRRAFATIVVHLHVPAPLYLDYVEEAIEKYARDRALAQVEAMYDVVEDQRLAPVTHLNELFARRRIEYRFDKNGRARWHGDEGVYEEVVRPALSALADPRLGAIVDCPARRRRRANPDARCDLVNVAAAE